MTNVQFKYHGRKGAEAEINPNNPEESKRSVFLIGIFKGVRWALRVVFVQI
jgi:hypothetical protein